MILGDEGAAQLGLKPGDVFHFSGEDFRVVGIYHSGVRLLDGAGIYSLEEFRRIHPNSRMNLAALDLVDGRGGAPAVIERIRRDFPDLEPLDSATAVDNFRHAAIFKAFAWGLSLIASAIAALGILNSMMTSVSERTREIGILRAVGWPPGMVLGMIVKEGVLVSLIGAICGVALGVGATELLVRAADIGVVRTSYPPRLWLEVLGLALTVGLVGSLPPAIKAVGIPPVEALRHE